MNLKKEEIEILDGIIKRFFTLIKRSRKKIVLMSYHEFLSLLNSKERKLIKKIQNLDISKYDKKTPFYGIKEIPKDLVVIRRQKFPISFLPKKVFWAFKKMNHAIQKDIKGELLIRSGYRSPAYQMLIFLYNLKKNDWKIKKTIKGVALPGYSEHGNPEKQAIDFATTGKKNRSFLQTKEYRWLKNNAAKFGFYLSFPKNNKIGVMFEPWHWHFKPLPVLKKQVK